MSELDEWEARAQPERKRIPCPDGKPGCLVLHLSTDLFDTPDKKKIRALIDLVRKKDEALKLVVNNPATGLCGGTWDVIDKALALTEKLGEKERGQSVCSHGSTEPLECKECRSS